MPLLLLSFFLLPGNTLLAPQAAPNQAGAPGPSVLKQRCLGCHDSKLKTSGLDLSSLQDALKGGTRGPALVPQQPKESLLFKRVRAGEMPPTGALPAEEIEVLRLWIEAGAPWTGRLEGPSLRPRGGPDWWSLQPLQYPIVPQTDGIPQAWRRSLIDRFIYAKLAEKGLQPSPPADRHTFIRRATFDLLGLPPTPPEIDAFVKDTSPDAYEKLIDRLLSSPHYGERWGRHWLDVVRFGESHGFEQNHLRERAWPYRDYVIRSLNEDKPFTQMILEQLAGDQVAPGKPEVTAATGFMVAGVYDTVKIKNVDGELQKRANELDDMVSTTSTAFLGLTVGCARCHDHKFDPILQKDYYRLQAVFAGVRHGEREWCTTAERQAYEKQADPIRSQIAEAEKQFESLKSRLSSRLGPEGIKDFEAQFKPAVRPDLNEDWFTPQPARFIRMTIHEVAPGGRPEPCVDEFEVFGPESPTVNLALASLGTKATARSSFFVSQTYDYKADFLNDGRSGNNSTWVSGEKGQGQFTLELPRVATVHRVVWTRDRQGVYKDRLITGYDIEISLSGETWERVASSKDRLPHDPKLREKTMLLSAADSTEQQAWKEQSARLSALNEELAAIAKLPTAYLGTFQQPEPTRLLKRGNPGDPGEEITAGSLVVMNKTIPGFAFSQDTPEGERRLGLARWLGDDRNPLTARVLANRIWHYHFGKGLVGTPSDFGFNGERPTHPELLDWLAARLQQLQWRLKPLHREIMLSAVYRQSCQHDAKAAAADNDGRLLWRFPPRRLEAEALRDAILSVSGKLDKTMGGPGFRLYNYKVDNVALYRPRDRYTSETFRRSVYHQAARSVRNDLLASYDCPDTTIPEPKRVVTTTVLQALNLLNDSFVVEQARFFAARLASEAGADVRAQVDLAFRLAFGRAPGEDELSASIDLVKRRGLWVFCRALFNANEFVYLM